MAGLPLIQGAREPGAEGKGNSLSPVNPALFEFYTESVYYWLKNNEVKIYNA